MAVADAASAWLIRQEDFPADGLGESFLEPIIAEAKETVRYLASRLASRLPAHVDVEDLFQVGMLGLIQSAQRFDETRGVKFQTYANRRVQGAMLDYLRSLDWRPRSVRRRNRVVAEAISAVEQRTGEAANTEDIAAEMGLTSPQYHQWMLESSAHHGSSVPHFEYGAGDSTDDLLNTVPDTSATPEETIVNEDLLDVLARAIEHLPETERTVMTLYYYEQLPMREIGKQLGVKQARVSQLHSQALRRLRLRMKGGRPFGDPRPVLLTAIAPAASVAVAVEQAPAAAVAATPSRVVSIASRQKVTAPTADLAPAA